MSAAPAASEAPPSDEAVTQIYAALAVSFCIAAQGALRQAVTADYQQDRSQWRDLADHFSKQAEAYTKLAAKYALPAAAVS